MTQETVIIEIGKGLKTIRNGVTMDSTVIGYSIEFSEVLSQINGTFTLFYDRLVFGWGQSIMGNHTAFMRANKN